MSEQYFAVSPDSKSAVRRIGYEAGGRHYEFYTDHGVFSTARVDHGTDILIRTVLRVYAAAEPGQDPGRGGGLNQDPGRDGGLNPGPGRGGEQNPDPGRGYGPILDLGCGYGPIGIVLADQFAPCEAVMMDVNERAMELARRTAEENGLAASVIVCREAELPDRRFRLVVTNPPIRAGKQTVYHFFALACEKLLPGGSFFAVLRKNQGAESAVRELRTLFGNCETIERQSGFHVLRCIKE